MGLVHNWKILFAQIGKKRVLTRPVDLAISSVRDRGLPKKLCSENNFIFETLRHCRNLPSIIIMD
jgi:hypothetical protein